MTASNSFHLVCLLLQSTQALDYHFQQCSALSTPRCDPRSVVVTAERLSTAVLCCSQLCITLCVARLQSVPMFIVLALRSVVVVVWLSLLVVVLLLDSHLVDPWHGSSVDVGPFCERARPFRLLGERSNALSDFAFLALGFALLCTAIEDALRVGSGAPNGRATSSLALRPHPQPANLIRRYPSLTALYGAANVIHACGTFFNHSCRCHFGHRLDLAGMWLVSFWCSLHSLCRLLSLLMPDFCQTGSSGADVKDVLPTFFYPLYLMAGWAFWLMSDVWYVDGSYDGREPLLVVANIAIVAVAEAAYLLLTHTHNTRAARSAPGSSSSQHPSSPPHPCSSAERYVGRYDVLAVGCASIGLGAVLGRLDATGAVCWPDSWLQLHAVWHVLAGACLGCLYLYYRWEEVPQLSVAARKER